MDTDTASAVAILRAPETIRLRCANVLRAVVAGRSVHFTVERARLGAVAERVARLTRARFPDGRIPYHSRWRHFEAGGVDRKAEFQARLAEHDTAALARAQIDLALISVLLDAGAGPQWRYAERESGQSFARSEGLAVASFRAFMAGRYSSDPAQPCRVDAQALARIDAASLALDFQVSPENPLVGLEGRAALLRRLGQALSAQPQTFGADAGMGRPGQLYDALATAPLTAARILALLLDRFSAIWPSGQSLGGVPLGDAWRHELAGGDGPSAGWVPFHKLSQWLAYSLLEPFEWAGITVQGLDALTGLPEYRNGGLLLDAGVITPRDPTYAQRSHSPADLWVIEWRALTVALLDELAPLVRTELGLSAAQLPLACILEGGTWAAGREIAAERRVGGAPPVTIDSDGTVF
jgi:hypothetical protein